MKTTFVTGFHPICEELANALGFTSVTSLRIEMRKVSEPLEVTITKFVNSDEARGLIEVFSRYNIEATPIGVSTE